MTPYELFQLEKYGNILPETENQDQENKTFEPNETQIILEIIESENL